MDQRTAPYATLLLRLVLGAFFILHIYRKFFITGLSAWWLNLEHNGYPSWVLVYVLIGEFTAAIALPLGIATRWVALFVLPLIVGTAQYWSVRHGFWFSDAGAEFPLLWAFGLVSLSLLGDGAYALGGRRSTAGARISVSVAST